MHEETNNTFIILFTEACKKCFGINLHTTLSETECKHFSNEIFDKTGLVIGAKSLKNYSVFVLNPDEAKPEKPSVATLDTLARYVLNAPYTDETKRKEKEAHHPYWFQYRNRFTIEKTTKPEITETVVGKKKNLPKNKRKIIAWVAFVTLIIAVVIVCLMTAKKSESFTDDFHNISDDTLKASGWFLQSEDKTWWSKRNEASSYLTLYTLTGDNWADSFHAPVIKNLLLRKISADRFTAEIHLDDFVPMKRWQQAGILLLEDTNLASKSLRLSIAYNDFFGGYNKPKEIILQAIASNGNEVNNPEEIIHLPLFSIEEGQDSLVAKNLTKSALRIEKNNNRFRFLYATGRAGNFAFKEALSKELDFQPKYIGIFALQGFVTDTIYTPVRFTYFSLAANNSTE